MNQNRRMNRLITITLALLGILALFSIATRAQTPDRGGLVITPVVESGSYSRSYDYGDDGRAGYESSGQKSDIVQKGFAVEFRGDSNWASKIRFSTGTVGTPTRFSNLTDGRHFENPYSQASNVMLTFVGNSRSLELVEEYRDGFLTYRFGVAYRLHEYTDSTVFMDPGFASSESEFTDSFFGPKFGVTANYKIKKLTAIASVDASPWMHHTGTYEFRLQNFGNWRYQGSTSSKAMDLDLGASYSLHKNVNVVGGWRRSAIHTRNSDFFLPNPYSTGKTPMKDSWNGIYVGVQLVH